MNKRTNTTILLIAASVCLVIFFIVSLSSRSPRSDKNAAQRSEQKKSSSADPGILTSIGSFFSRLSFTDDPGTDREKNLTPEELEKLRKDARDLFRMKMLDLDAYHKVIREKLRLTEEESNEFYHIITAEKKGREDVIDFIQNNRNKLSRADFNKELQHGAINASVKMSAPPIVAKKLKSLLGESRYEEYKRITHPPREDREKRRASAEREEDADKQEQG